MPGRKHRRSSVVVIVLSLLWAALPAAGWAGPAPDATVYSPAFADVPDDHMFAGPIRAVLAAGITKGCNQQTTRFCPNDPVTRGQMAAFLTRALQLPNQHTIDFTDDDNSTFESDIERLAAAGITKGCNQQTTRFCPNDPVTRGQMAVFLTRGLGLVVPRAVPTGVTLQRDATTAPGRGTRVTLCRDEAKTVVVRSLAAGAGLDGLRMWGPSTLELSSGELDLPTDRWYLPAGTGCDTLEVVWDPRSNTLGSPLATTKVVSGFGYRIHPILGGKRLHAGVDLEAHASDAVHAAASGVVLAAGPLGGYGNRVDVEHPGGLVTRYAHMSRIDVAPGQVVEGGQVVGLVGCTGLCTAPHLHFETREFDVPVDPMTYLP